MIKVCKKITSGGMMEASEASDRPLYYFKYNLSTLMSNQHRLNYFELGNNLLVERGLLSKCSKWVNSLKKGENAILSKEEVGIKKVQICALSIIQKFSTFLSESFRPYHSSEFESRKAIRQFMLRDFRLNNKEAEFLYNLMKEDECLSKEIRVDEDSFTDIQELVKVDVYHYVKFKRKLKEIEETKEIGNNHYHRLIYFFSDPDIRPFFAKALKGYFYEPCLDFFDAVQKFKQLSGESLKEEGIKIINKFILEGSNYCYSIEGSNQFKINLREITFNPFKKITKEEITQTLFDEALSEVCSNSSIVVREMDKF